MLHSESTAVSTLSTSTLVLSTVSSSQIFIAPFSIFGFFNLSFSKQVDMNVGEIITVVMDMGSVNVSVTFCNDTTNAVYIGYADESDMFSKFLSPNNLTDIRNQTCQNTKFRIFVENLQMFYVILHGTKDNIWNNGTIEIDALDQSAESTSSSITASEKILLGGGLSAGAIAGIVGGIIILALLTIAIITAFAFGNRFRRREQFENDNDEESSGIRTSRSTDWSHLQLQ
jgi:hypothetical protein